MTRWSASRRAAHWLLHSGSVRSRPRQRAGPRSRHESPRSWASSGGHEHGEVDVPMNRVDLQHPGLAVGVASSLPPGGRRPASAARSIPTGAWPRACRSLAGSRSQTARRVFVSDDCLVGEVDGALAVMDEPVRTMTAVPLAPRMAARASVRESVWTVTMRGYRGARCIRRDQAAGPATSDRGRGVPQTRLLRPHLLGSGSMR
jgi:hypothetical protein